MSAIMQVLKFFDHILWLMFIFFAVCVANI